MSKVASEIASVGTPRFGVVSLSLCFQRVCCWCFSLFRSIDCIINREVWYGFRVAFCFVDLLLFVIVVGFCLLLSLADDDLVGL